MIFENSQVVSEDYQFRSVRLGETPYELRTWDETVFQEKIGFEFRKGDQVIFLGHDFRPGHSSVDGDQSLRSLLTFLTLRPGDTDDEYFDQYTPEQIEFRDGDAEEIAMFSSCCPDESEYPLVDIPWERN